MNFPSIRIEGAILSPDILDRLDDNAAGQRPSDFSLPAGTLLKDEITRVWADAQDYWRIYQRKLADIPAESTSLATTETRNLWIVPLLGLLGYQLERQHAGPEINGKIYPFSHVATNRANTPVHIIGSRDPAGLDRRPARSGGSRMSAHAMVQEYLNLTDHLYAIVTDGHTLRLLRDSSRLVKLSYLEFDLDRIFTDGLTPDFFLLYRLLHASRLPAHTTDAPRCLIERYHQDTLEQGTRIRDGLRNAVTEAIQIFGTGFLDPRNGNTALRQSLRDGTLSSQKYYRQLLRLIYRLLFLMVLEDRRLVFPTETPREKSDLYYRHYSIQRLRRLASNRIYRQSRHHDAWLALRATFSIFEQPEMAAKLGTSALGGHLFRADALDSLPLLKLSNETLFAALDCLCHFHHPETQQRTAVNFGALATEEFGSVYESLLELHPFIIEDAVPRFVFKQSAGNERKTTASYYTHSDLVESLLNTALVPVIDQRLRDWEKLKYPSRAEALLDLKICDPACGSGHFLIAAAQRLARRLALVRANNEEPSITDSRQALREVISHCIFGVDLNPMAVELCRVALWLEAAVPGRPLTFLEHHIKIGNSLIGGTPALIRAGIPDEAYNPIAGDTKEACKWMKKLNKEARDEQQTQADLFSSEVSKPWQKRGNLPAAYATFETVTENTYDERIAKEQHYAKLIESSDYLSGRQLYDAWCAAFVWPKTSVVYGQELHTEHIRRLEKNPHDLDAARRTSIQELAHQYGFFHFHLEFPQVFREPAPGTSPEHPHSGLNGGFDCILV